jgi:drug/metabolite transporter (DMT)-like permease
MKKWLWLALLFNVIWAGSYPATKLLMRHAPFFLVTSTRYLIAVLPLVLFTARRYGFRMSRGDFARCAALGVASFTVCPALMYAGVAVGRAADAAILTATEPLMISLGAYFYLREPLSRRTIAALLLAFVGALVLSEAWRAHGTIAPTAIALIAAGVAAEAGYSVLTKALLPRHAPIKILTVALLAGSAVNAVILGGLGWWPRLALLTLADWSVLVFFLALLCASVGFLTWNLALQHDSTANVAITIFVQPVVAIFLAWWWVDEVPAFYQGVGTLLIVAALGIALRPRESRRAPQIV